MPQTAIAADIRSEAGRLAASVEQAGVPLRLMGGLAVWLRCPSVRQPPFARDYADLDFAASSRARQAVRSFLEGEGYVPEKLFNALHGAQRLNYAEPEGRWTVDVIFDELAMSHRLDLRDAFRTAGSTLSPADLLLTKLQIWEINRKDLGDALCLLADHALDERPRADPRVEPDADAIDVARLTAILASDWGWCHTLERNLGRVSELAAEVKPAAPRFSIADQIATLRAAIEKAPKSLAWKARARVGERVRWYETPEEVRH